MYTINSRYVIILLTLLFWIQLFIKPKLKKKMILKNKYLSPYLGIILKMHYILFIITIVNKIMKTSLIPVI